MEFVQVRFDRLFDIARDTYRSSSKKVTHFGFESRGKRYFDANVPEWPKIEEGMTVIALLKIPHDWSKKSLLGWVDCTDGSVVCDTPSLHLGIFAINVFFLPLFLLSEVHNPLGADFIAAVVFGGGAIWSLYRFCETLLVKQALKTVVGELNLANVRNLSISSTSKDSK